jgi:hypothetical protein
MRKLGVEMQSIYILRQAALKRLTLELERLTQLHNYTNTVITYVNFLGQFITNVVLILAFLYRVMGATLDSPLPLL